MTAREIEPVKTALTTCPFCSCGCGLYLQTSNGHPVGVAPSESHPVSSGTLCARGWAAHEAATWGTRLSQPLVRRSGDLQPATWDEALARAAQGLLAALGAGRAVGVLGSARATNEENFLAVKLARAALDTPYLDTSLGWTYVPALRGFARASGMSAPAATLDDLATSDVILVLDSDLASSHPKLASRILRTASRGATLVTMAHRRTQLARLSSLFVPLKPALESSTLDELARCLGSAGDSRPTPEVSGSAEVAQAARLLARASRPLVVVGPSPGLVEEEGPVATVASILAAHPPAQHGVLPILLVPPRANLRGAVAVGASPQYLPGLLPAGEKAAVQRLASLWGRPVAARAGETAASFLAHVRALVVVCDDPLATLPSPAAARDALANLDCLIVLDAYLSPTAQLADVVLPVAAPGETDGSMTNLEGRVQAVVAAAAPPADARPGWRALADLLGAVGLPCQVDSAAAVRREIEEAIPAYAGVAADAGLPRFENWPRPAVGETKPAHEFPARLVFDGSPFVLTFDGFFDWAADSLVSNSPSLSRNETSRKRQFPRGFVEMAKADAATLGVRAGWNVKVATENAELVLPVVLRDDVPGGTLIAPFAFREVFSPLLDTRSGVAVNVQGV